MITNNNHSDLTIQLLIYPQIIKAALKVLKQLHDFVFNVDASTNQYLIMSGAQVKVKFDEVKEEIDNKTNYVITLSSSQLNDISGDIKELVNHIQKFMFRNSPSHDKPIKIEQARMINFDNDKGTQTIMQDSKETQTIESTLGAITKKQRTQRMSQSPQNQAPKKAKIIMKTQAKLKEITNIQPQIGYQLQKQGMQSYRNLDDLISNSNPITSTNLMKDNNQFQNQIENRETREYQVQNHNHSSYETFSLIDQLQNSEQQTIQSVTSTQTPKQIPKLKIITREQIQNQKEGASKSSQQRKKLVQVQKEPPQSVNYQIEYQPKPARRRGRKPNIPNTTHNLQKLDTEEDDLQKIEYAKQRKQIWRVCLICGEKCLRLNMFNKHLFEAHGIEQRKYWKPLQ